MSFFHPHRGKVEPAWSVLKSNLQPAGFKGAVHPQISPAASVSSSHCSETHRNWSHRVPLGVIWSQRLLILYKWTLMLSFWWGGGNKSILQEPLSLYAATSL